MVRAIFVKYVYKKGERYHKKVFYVEKTAIDDDQEETIYKKFH